MFELLCYAENDLKERSVIMKKKISNFTLVEILTVVAIIGILAGIGLGVTSYVTNRNREVQTQTTIKMLEMVLEQYKSKYGAYPAIVEPKSDLGQSVFKLPLKPKGDSGNDKTDELTSFFHDVTYNGDYEITGIKGVNIVRDGNSIIILDGWESPIIYVYPGVFNRKKYDLGSAGANKMIGEETTAKLTKNAIPGALTRAKNGTYRQKFGTVDDITNFKR